VCLCYYNLRKFFTDRITQHSQAQLAAAQDPDGGPPPVPDFMPTEDDIRKMFGKDRSKSNHAPAAINPRDAKDPAMQESGYYAPSGGSGLGSGCNCGAPCYTLNREDPTMTALRLWPEQVVAPMVQEMREYVKVWQDSTVTCQPTNPLEEARKPVGGSQIRSREPIPLW